MGDIFKEQLVKRLPSGRDKAAKAGIVCGGVLIIVAVFFMMFQLALIAAAALAFIIYYLFGLFDREYEYILTNSNLDIDCIFGKSRRKEVFKCDMKEIILMAHASAKIPEQEFSTAKETYDCGSGIIGENTYFILAIVDGKRVKVVFEPNEMMFNAIKPYVGAKKLKL